MESVLIGLGSNLGDRKSHLLVAADRLAAASGVSWRRLSTVIETQPVGDPSVGPLGGPYLNAAAEVLTALQPREFLDLCLAIEADLGRTRSSVNAPRTIDLDILLFGDQVVEAPGLIVPHPRLLDRQFVLEPMAEIAPGRRHPITGRTLLEHWEEWKGCHDHHR